MCEPTTVIGVSGLVLAAAGTTASVIQQRRSASAAAELALKQSNDQALQTLTNMALADRETDNLNAVFDEKKRALEEEAAKIVGTQRTQFAAGNILLGAGGSAEDAEAEVQRTLQDDLAAIEFNRERAIFAQRTGNLQLLGQSLSEIDSRNLGARNTIRAGRFNAAATGLQGASTIAGGTYNFLLTQGYGPGQS